MFRPNASHEQHLLTVVRIDGVGAIVVGTSMLLLHVPLAALYGMTPRFVTILGLVNLGYSTMGLTLSRRRLNPRWGIGLLIAANAAWTIIAWTLAWRIRNEVSSFGTAHLVIEGAYVLGLASIEAGIAFNMGRFGRE